ncbi:MAG: CNNM domain-containing protein [Planctomycetaceae bacterium]|nr:CNNM domain-containing protein [Planctomycetaceae bacterium]
MTMVLLALLLGAAGFFLCGFFSGTETGFYRIPRIRVQLDAVEGNRFSQLLLLLINKPSFFIATILIGNNIACYLVSIASVIFVQTLFAASGVTAEILATIIVTPFLFAFGEMFPKYIFLQIPEKMLKRVIPLFFVFLVLMLPVTLIVWLFNRMVALLFREKREPLRMTLARRELSKSLDEGAEVGLILPTQRQLTKNVFAVASKSIRLYTLPLVKFPAITRAMPSGEALKIAREHALPEFPVFSDWNPELPVGYVRTIELALAVREAELQTQHQLDGKNQANQIPVPVAFEMPIRELIEFDQEHTPLNALLLFQETGESFALVVDDDRILGVISEKQMMNVMFSGIA